MHPLPNIDEIADEKVVLLRRHLQLLLEKNASLNLTRIDDPDEAWVLHVIDSLCLLPYVEQAEGPVLDLGTGGGFPGLPLGIVSGLPMTLLDSLAKKADAVRGFCSELGLQEQVEVVAERAETLALLRPEHYACVVARAVAPLAVLLEYGAPLLRAGGLLVAAKGRLDDEERVSGERAAAICGMELVELLAYELPDGKGSRQLAVYRKTAEPSVKLPRRPGMARKRPLGAQ